MKRFSIQIIIGLIAIAALAAGAIWYLHRDAEINDRQDSAESGNIILQPVSVMSVSLSQSSVMPQRYTATVVARRTSQLAFQAAERVDEILFDEGDYVTKGQLLARQDRAAILAQYNAAVARSKQTAAVLAELEQGPRQETIAAARADLESLKSQFEFAQTELRRQIRLRKGGAGVQQEYDAARFDAAAKKSSVAAAKQKLSELETGTRKEKIDAQRGAMDVIKATIEQAKTRLDQTELVAPFSGRISRRYVDEGSLPQRGTPVLEIMETGQLEVRFGVSPAIAKQLSQGETITFTSGKDSHKGTVRQVKSMLDRATRTQQIIVRVNDSNGSGLIDGQTVNVEFAVQSDDPGFWIPTEALQPQVRGLWSVMVANGSPGDPKASGEAVAERRDVEVLATWHTWSRVRGTLEESDHVIVEGGSRVSAGQVVSAMLQEIPFPWQQEKVVRLPELNQETVQ